MAYGGAERHNAVKAPARKTSPVCLLVRAEARPGAERELKALLADFAFQVRETERGCLAYVVTHAMGSPTHFAAHARFADWSSMQRHAVTPHLARVMPRLDALLVAPVSLEIFLEV
jgi:quinol monooxygenase YgiN